MYNVSIVTPTLNIMRTFEEYMYAIMQQDYPHENIEIIVADGGSKDETLKRFKECQESGDIKISIFENPLKTAEAGKAVGVRRASGDVICLLDSDNILPDKHWLSRMMEPFEDENIVASEPISFTYRKQDNLINRYTAALGMGDPLCLFTGNYDRECAVTGKWCTMKREEVDKGNYLSIKFTGDAIPTIGANGFIMRTKELLENFEGDYLFDIDVLWELFKKNPECRVAKVKTGIIHLFAPNVKTFYRKQKRRIKDFLYFSDSKGRTYPWKSNTKLKIILFCLCCITIVPLIVQSVIGFCKKPDFAIWLFHPIACWITLWTYGIGTVTGIFHKEAVNRDDWKQ